MRIRELILKDFGPFRRYKISFVEDDEVCILLTGKNNEGKSSILNGLRLLDAATRVINKRKQEIIIDDDYYYKLLQQDVENLLVGRMIHNYSKATAQITGVFDDGSKINVYLDPNNEITYSDFERAIPKDVQRIFGFIPPLGPLNEEEDIITNLPYLKASINTSLAPRHLRNHLYQILPKDDLDLVRLLIKKSWHGIELLDYDLDYSRGKIYCYYKEDGIEREISWAGQGLQVWFQIISHLVRLRNTSVLILDEPDINLHPEKQNELIGILKDYYHGSILIATHSVELMNNVSVSHEYTLLLDRDYYPEEYLKRIRNTLQAAGIRLVFTLGKEIENIFLTPEILSALIPESSRQEFKLSWDEMFNSVRLDCYASFLTLHEKFLDRKLDKKTITKLYTPTFEKCWNDLKKRHCIIAGKEALKVLRAFYRNEVGKNLSQAILIEKVVQTRNGPIKTFVEQIFHLSEAEEQVLHY